MNRDELNKVAKGLSVRLGRMITLVGAEEIAGGFQSDAFKLTAETGEVFFLKRIKYDGEAGFEYPERHLSSLITSHGMGKRAGIGPAPVGVILVRKDEVVAIPEVDEHTTLYHAQTFAEALGPSYWSLLNGRRSKSVVDADDRRETETIARLMVSIHHGKKPSSDPRVLKTIYKDSLQSLLAHLGYFFRFLADFGSVHPFLSRRKHGEYIGMILRLIYRWEERFERLCPLHGDFWGTNIFFTSDGAATAVDFSRIPYGEPGIDIGYFVAQHLWFYHDTGNVYFKTLGELFIQLYIQKTGDKKIRETLTLPFGLLALLYCNPRFHPDNNPVSEKSFFLAVCESVRKRKLVWGKPLVQKKKRNISSA